ncbi:MAG: hypothetical protein NZ534_00230 [Bacteroidia bacterium]|nr:hypothetical protein [Bacteroidia bacterium]
MVMRIINRIVWMFLLAATTCGPGERTPPPPAVYDADENAPYGTGGLVVKVVGGPKYEPEARADVSLYASMADYQADVYLGRIVTGRNGRADFGYLNAGN